MANNLQDDNLQADVTPEAVLGGLMPADVQSAPLSDANPFMQSDLVAPAQDAGSAFSALTPTEQVTAPTMYSDSQRKRTSMLGALAQQRTGLDDTADNRLASLSAMNEETIQAGKEKVLRQQIALQTRTNQVQTIENLQNKVLNMSDPSVAGTPLAELINMGLDAKSAPLNEDSLEEQGVARLQTMAASDPDQAALMDNLQKQGDVLDRVRDNVIKMELYNRELDVLKTAKAEQGWFKDGVDIAASFIPFRSFFSATGNVEGTKGSFFSLPSTQVNREVQTFWNMPLDEFKQKIPDVMTKFTKQTFGLGSDLTQALSTADTFAGGGFNNSDALTFNVMAGADAAFFLPLDRMLMVPSKMARVVGNRAASADIATMGIAAEIHGVPNGLEGLQAPAHSIEESMPSSLVPNTMSFVRPDVGVTGDIADRLSQLKESTTAARKLLTSTDRLTPEQLAEAVAKENEKVRLEFRDDPIADYKAEIAPPENSLLLDPDMDPDTLSFMNARGDVYKNADEELRQKAMDNLFAERDAAQKTAKEETFTVARKMDDGTVQIGEKGQVHAELLSDEELAKEGAPAGKMGFADKNGKFYTREEAAAALGQKGRLESMRASGQAKEGFGKRGIKPTVPVDEIPDAVGVGGIRGETELSRNPDTGIYSLNFYLGKRYSSGGFITREGAEAAAVRRGFSLQDVGMHQNSDGQWFVKVKQAVTETGISTPTLREADFPDLGFFPRASSLIKSADNILPEMFNQARITQTMMKQKYLASVVGPYVKVIKAVSPKAIKHLSTVMKVGEREQRWFTQNEFEFQFERVAGRMPNQKETLAYYAAKELSDLNYHIFNNALYAEKAKRGIVTVSAKNDAIGFNTNRVNGTVIEKPDFDNGRWFDVDEGASVRGRPASKLADKFNTGNYRAIDLETPIMRENGDPVKHILVHKSSSTVGPLEAEQLGYVAGGSRENRFKWFVKQARSGTFSDGQQYWLQPKTHIAARTGKQAREWADSMENARRAYFSEALSDAEKRRIIELSPAESFDKFDAMVQSGEISKDHPFETLYDRATPQAMSHLGDDAIKWTTEAETPEESYAISRGRMYYSKKGERLTDPNGDYAEIMDPFTTLHKAVNNAAQTLAFGDYNKQVVDEWARVAAPFMNKKSVGNNWDSYNLFFNGKLSDELFRSNPQFANQLELSRNTHKRLLGTQLPEQKMAYNAARRFADWVETKGAFGEKVAGAVLDRMSANPVTAVRGMVFDAKLGFFDPGQLIVQTQTAVMAMSVDPINGARTASTLLPVTHLLLNQSENLLDYYSKSLRLLHGLEPQDFKTMIRSLRNSGWLNVGGEMVQLDQYINTIGGSAIARTANQVREAGRIPFNMSEKFNRVVAYQIAWQNVRKEFPKLAGEDRKFQQLVNKKADDLSMNMTSSSAAYWQKGVLSIPTQFLAYQARVLENILPQSFGGSARFTGAQKLRLALGQLLLYGSAGVPLGDQLVSWASSQYEAATGKPMSPETWRVMTKGFWDTAMFYGTDGKLDTDFAARAGQGQAWTQFFQKLTDGSMNSVLEVAGGPVGAVSGKMIDTVGKMTTYMKAEQFGSLSPAEFEMIAKDWMGQISSLNRAQKAYTIWKMGRLKDPKSGETIVEVDKLSAIAAALGIPMRQETEFWDRSRDLKARNDDIRDYGKMIANVRRQAFEAMADGDDQKAHHYEMLASGLLLAHKDDPMFMTQVAGEANKQLNYSNAEWDALVQRIYEQTGKEPPGGR